MRIALFIISMIALTSMKPAKKITLWMIGDSTMSVKDPKAFPEHGWGMPFVYFWDSTVKIENRAMNGRSTRTFLEEKRWEPVMNHMQEGDYVFIQFGHNDEVSTKKSFVPENAFKTNLVKYISDTRSKKAIPVLLTPVARRKFDSTGHIRETHAVYAQIVRDVAKENHVPLIDLSEKSKNYYQQLGMENSKWLFNHLSPGDHPNYPDGKVDDTHFNEYGARKIAEMVLKELRVVLPELTERIIKPVKK